MATTLFHEPQLNDTGVAAAPAEVDYHALNALLNLYDADGRIQFEADRQAAHQYFLQHVNQNTVFFHSLKEKLDYLIEQGYYEPQVLAHYDFDYVKSLFKRAYAVRFRFPTFMGAFKYYTSYTLKTFDGSRYLERFEDRVCMVALTLAAGDRGLAEQIVEFLNTKNSCDVPPSLVDAQRQMMQQEFLQQLRRSGQRFSPDQARQIASSMQVDAEKKVRAGLLMAAIAKKNEFKVTEEDIENGMKELAEESGQNVAKIRTEYREKQKRDMLVGMILEDKILDFIESKSTIVDLAKGEDWRTDAKAEEPAAEKAEAKKADKAEKAEAKAEKPAKAKAEKSEEKKPAKKK